MLMVLRWEMRLFTMNMVEESKMKELNVLYQEITDYVLAISDFDWEQIVIRFTKDETHGGIMIYYKMKGHYRLDDELIEENCIDESKYDTTLFDLAGSIIKVKRVTEKNELPEWNSMIFIIKKDKKYEVSYSFEEWDETSIRDEIVWRYKFLNILPIEKHMKYIEGVEQTLL